MPLTVDNADATVSKIIEHMGLPASGKVYNQVKSQLAAARRTAAWQEVDIGAVQPASTEAAQVRQAKALKTFKKQQQEQQQQERGQQRVGPWRLGPEKLLAKVPLQSQPVNLEASQDQQQPRQTSTLQDCVRTQRALLQSIGVGQQHTGANGRGIDALGTSHVLPFTAANTGEALLHQLPVFS